MIILIYHKFSVESLTLNNGVSGGRTVHHKILALRIIFRRRTWAA